MSGPTPGVFRFDVFEADVQAGELRKSGTPVKLQGQPWQVLVALLEQSGRIVTREELRDRLWPTGTFVDFDHSLNIAVNKIRDALGDDAAQPRFVQTVARKGYRFIAPIETVAEQASADAARRFDARWVAAIAIGIVATIAAGIVWRTLPFSSHRHTIAVLPLRSLNGDPDAGYFSDGLTDEIIYNLSVIDGLEVKSRTSSFQFKGRDVNVRDVGRALKSDLVLEGTLLRGTGRVRLNVALVRASDDVTIWTQHYDRDAHDIFAVQDDISRAIVNELRLKGIGGQRRYTTDPDTYDAYLRAVAMTHEDAPGHLPQLNSALALFQQVTARDPQFVPAYAAIAYVYSDMGNRGRSAEIVPRMREATMRALTLDPMLPQVQAALGLVRARELRWQEAESAFRRALDLDPNLASVHAHLAMFVLQPLGRSAEALAELRRAIELDPLSSSRRIDLAYALLRTGASTEALEISRAVLAATPDEGFAKQLEARALMQQGRFQEALAILDTLGPASHAYLGYAYAKLGRRAEAEALASEDDPAAARHQVVIYAALGDSDRAFAALQQLARADDDLANLDPGEPEVASLRKDPRMRAFCAQRGIPLPPL